MKIDRNSHPDTKKKYTRYDFRQAVHGTSVHVETSAERGRVMSAFKDYTTRTGKGHLYAMSHKVDATDPRGEGYRVFFRSRIEDSPTIDGAPAATAQEEI